MISCDILFWSGTNRITRTWRDSVTSIALRPANDYPSVSEAAMTNMGQFTTTDIHANTAQQSVPNPCIYLMGFDLISHRYDNNEGGKRHH